MNRRYFSICTRVCCFVFSLGIFSACSSDENIIEKQQTENTEYETQIQNEAEKVIENNFEDENETLLVEEMSVDLSKYTFDDMNLAVGCEFDLSEICSEEGLIISSKKENVVRVLDGGKIEALAEGKTEITVTSKEQKVSFDVCVTNPILNMNEVYKIAGNTVSLDVFGTTGTIEWESDNEAIATVENGVVYAMPSGCGLSTTIHAYVDGADLECKINVEPIPQLQTAYKIYSEAHVRSTVAGDYNCNLIAYSNANKIIRFTEEEFNDATLFARTLTEPEEVINLNDVDYSDGLTFPVYETYHKSNYGEDDFTHIEVYLVGTSQEAKVLAKSTQNYEMQVSYKAENGFGVLSIWTKALRFTNDNVGIVYLEVDGYEYCFNVQSRGYGINRIEWVPKSDTVEEYSENDVVTMSYSGDYSFLTQNAYTFIPNDIMGKVGDAFVEKVQDKAISMCVDLLFEMILPF